MKKLTMKMNKLTMKMNKNMKMTKMHIVLEKKLK